MLNVIGKILDAIESVKLQAIEIKREFENEYGQKKEEVEEKVASQEEFIDIKPYKLPEKTQKSNKVKIEEGQKENDCSNRFITSDDILKGVVMAEILAKPRSLRGK